MSHTLQQSFETSWQWLAIAGLLAITVTLTLLWGVPGLLLGGVLVMCWRRLPPEYSFAIGQFALVAAAPEIRTIAGLNADLGLLALGEVGLIALLVTPLEDGPHALHAGGLTASLVTIGVLVGWLSQHARWVGPTWQASAWLLGGGLVLAYSLHRYERWQLGNPSEARSDMHE